MGLQEPDWWVSPEYYEPFDRFVVKRMLPIYCRKASYFFPMSTFDLEESRKYLRLPLKNASVTYTCPGRHMKPIDDPEVLETFRGEYKLPDRFLVCVTRVDHPGLDKYQKVKKFFPGKNPETVLRAFVRCREEIPHHLVFAGRSVREYMEQSGIRRRGFQEGPFHPVCSIRRIAKAVQPGGDVRHAGLLRRLLHDDVGVHGLRMPRRRLEDRRGAGSRRGGSHVRRSVRSFRFRRKDPIGFQ